MKHVRQPWMIRAAFATMGVVALLTVFSIAWMWLYREVAEIAPDWMVERRRGGLRPSYLELAGITGYMLASGVLTLAATLTLFRLARIPDDVFLPGQSRDYPFHERKLSREAQIRAGQEGYLGAKLDQLAEFARSPLTPPPRKRD